MPVFFAPSLPAPVISPGLPAPIVAPGINSPVPFARPGLPPVAPIAPAFPVLPPALPALGAPVAAPAAGGLASVAAQGAALLGAFGLGLAIGNEIYEEGLNRPFGPSLGDLFFPEGQPQPLPVPEPLPRPDPRGQCETLYNLTFTYDASFQGEPITSRQEFSADLQGPLSFSRWELPATGGLKAFALTGAGEVEILFRGGPTGAWKNFTLTSFAPTRQDNLPDDCLEFEPEPLREPQSLPRPRLPRPETPSPGSVPSPEPFRLPFIPELPNSPDVPYTPFVPDIGRPFNPELVPPALLIPFTPPLPRTPPEPVTQPDPQLQGSGTPRLPAPPTPRLECCPSLERKLDDLLDREECEPCDLTGIEEQLRRIAEQLSAEGIGSVDLTPCDAEEETIEVYAGVGIDGIFSAIEAITKSLNLINENTRCEGEGCVSAVPDWWQVRKGSETPQLSVVLRKQGTKNYHALNIPHPITEPRPKVSPITPYTAGNWQSTIYCSDNSKFIVNAKTKTESVRVATEAAALIKPEFLPSPLQISTTERRGFTINTSAMIPRYLDYFPEGQKGRRPEWRVNLE